MARADNGPVTAPGTGVQGLLFLALALLVAFSVLLINRGPLFYIDTGGYLSQGNAALEYLLPAPEEAPGGGEARDGSEAVEEDKTASGARSMLYAVTLALLWRAQFLVGLPIINVLMVFATVWLAARVAARIAPHPPTQAVLVALPLIVASATSLPFYMAYLMPDIFAAIGLIVVAMLTAFGRQMRAGEIALALLIGSGAAVLHPSHLAIIGLMLPLVAIVALLQSRRRWWLPPLLVLALVAAGLAERKAFSFVAKSVANKEVTYTPHLTARLVTDGPGLAYLDEHCPDPDLATCRLHEALSWSDDPYRLTATHINFETSERLGSYRRLPQDDQAAIAREQIRFFRLVLADRPVETVLAFAANTLAQARMNSIEMTVPTEPALDAVRSLSRVDNVHSGPLTQDRGWIPAVDTAHGAIYAVTLVAALGLMLWPGRCPGAVRIFALMLLLGVLVNAFVCGGVSQPANRYGARVSWLVPFAAAFLTVFAFGGRGVAKGGDR